jgi:outer membrane protein assembly factor BamA
MIKKLLTRLSLTLLMMLAPAGAFAQFGCLRSETSRPQLRAETSRTEATSPVKIRIGELSLTGQTGFTPVEQEAIVASVKDKAGDDAPKWLQEFEGRIQDAWQQRGYFKAEIKAQTHLISETPSEKTFDVTAHVESGRLYRLGDISFVGGTQFAPEQLLPLFLIHSGEIFNTHQISEGIDALRKAYGARGFIDFIPVPTVSYDEQHGLVSLAVELEEGRQFRISQTHVFGLDAASAKALLVNSGLEPGDVADPEMADRFEKQHPSEIERFIDSAKGTVCIQIKFGDS